jgi:2-phosphoglycerate kinase
VPSPECRPARGSRDREHPLRNVYWIGGGSGAGKSTVARHLAGRYGLRLYATDDVMREHADRTSPEDSPFLHEFIAMDMDQRWADRSPEVMLDSFHWYRGEGFGLIVEDLLGQPPVIAEGFRLLPHLVQPLAVPGQAIWLLPTDDFRRAAFESRGSTWQIAGRTSDPEKALHNLLERERMFTHRLREQTRDLGLATIEVDGTMTEDELTERVAEALGLRPGDR